MDEIACNNPWIFWPIVLVIWGASILLVCLLERWVRKQEDKFIEED